MMQAIDTVRDFDERFSRANKTLWKMVAADRAYIATLGDVGVRFGLSAAPTVDQIAADLSAIKIVVLRSIACNLSSFQIDLDRYRSYTYASYLDGRDHGNRVTRAMERLVASERSSLTLH